jgi:IS30 family transposase
MKKSIRALALARGVAPSTVHRHRKRRTDYRPNDDGTVMSKGLDGKLRPAQQVDTTDRDKRIRKLHRAKMPMRAIAAEIGCSVGTVHRVISKGK